MPPRLTAPWWSPRDIVNAVWVGLGLLVYVVLVYVVVVLGGGMLTGHTSSPDVLLSVAATAIVALSLGRVQGWVQLQVSRLRHGGRPAPYDILRRLSQPAAESMPADELPARMAHVLAAGVGAEQAQVWLAVENDLDLAATWPSDAPVDGRVPTSGEPRQRTHEVRQAGELLGILVVRERPGSPLTPVEERLFAGLADQAGLVLRGVRLHAELARRAADLSLTVAELRESRERLVEAHDSERRRLERDIHDGAQQHLVALAVNLRLAHTLLPGSPERADQILADQDRAVAETIETLTGLSRGIYPRLLNDAGLVAALESAKDRGPIPVTLVAAGIPRFPAGVESAVYFCALEALQNAAKHSAASSIRLTISTTSDGLAVTVEDDGVGFDVNQASSGSGLANMHDRVDALGGLLTATSVSGRTVITVQVPAMPVVAEPRST